jgi:hypothetical protein
MQAILSKYDMDNAKFYKMLHDINGIIAGSAALCAMVGGFEPNDIDIWIDEHEITHIDGVSVYSIIHNYFTNNGYKTKISNTTEDNEYYENVESTRFHKIISCIVRFVNEKGKCVQVIWTHLPTVSVMDAIKSFDLSVSATWFVPNGSPDGEGKIYTYDPTNTFNRIMYRLDDMESPHILKRIEKYESYGFKLKIMK